MHNVMTCRCSAIQIQKVPLAPMPLMPCPCSSTEPHDYALGPFHIARIGS